MLEKIRETYGCNLDWHVFLEADYSSQVRYVYLNNFSERCRRRKRRTRTADMVTSTNLMWSEVLTSANFWITLVWVITWNSDSLCLRFGGIWCHCHQGGRACVVSALNMAMEVSFETFVNMCGTAQCHLRHDCTVSSDVTTDRLSLLVCIRECRV
jgi:hypothetical protein